MINELIRGTLPDFVQYVDIWPLTDVHPFTPNVHLDPVIIDAELAMIARAIKCG